MADLASLHKIRVRIGKSRQSTYATTLEKFHRALKKSGISSPYNQSEMTDMMRDGYGKLENFPEYTQGSAGKQIDERDAATGKLGEYVYRMVLIYSLASIYKDKCKPVKANFTKLNPAAFTDKDVYHKEFFRLAGLDENSRDWIRLDRIINRGELYKNRRKFSFWTNTPLCNGDVLSNSFKIGYASDWLAHCAVVLRCKIEDLYPDNPIRIPTILDAFTEPIFLPIRENCQQINNGLAIDIELSPLGIGYNEYVIGPIEIEKIQFQPVCINSLSARQIKFDNNSDLWDMLENFYKTL